MSAPLHHPWPDPPPPGEARSVAEGVLWMRLPLPMALDHVNVYALRDGDGWVLFDTGLSTARTRTLWERLLHGPLGGAPVRQVIVSHHHPDHVGLAGWFQREHGAELIMSRPAWLLARMLHLDVQDRPTAEMLAFWRGAGMNAAEFARRSQERPFNFADVLWPMPLGLRSVAEGEVLRIGGRDWIVRLGEGHAPAQITLWSGELVLGADQLLPSISPNLGVYATEPEADPVGAWLCSCTALAAHAQDAQLVLPGHKLPYTGLPGRLTQLIDNHHGALARLRAWLDQPRTAEECFTPLFRRSIGAGEYGLALAESLGHLNHLLHRGEVCRNRRADGAWLWQIG